MSATPHADRVAIQAAAARERAQLQPQAPGQAPGVQEVRLVPVPTIPDTTTWQPGDQARTAAVLSHELAEMLATYGAGVTFEALAIALAGDMHAAAGLIQAPRLQAAYQAAAVMLAGMGDQLQHDEDARQ